MQRRRLLDHAILMGGSLFMLLPVVVLILSATHSPAVIAREGVTFSVGDNPLDPLVKVVQAEDLFGNGVNLQEMLVNSMIVATGIALIKTMTSLLAAFALVYFRLRFASLIFGVILLSMFFPIETRILPTFLVARDLGLLNSYAGVILPIVASGLGTLIFRQYFKQVPEELCEAAKLDGAHALKFFWDILLPMSVPMITALFAMVFVLGWNQYVWPIMINTTSEDHYTIMRGIERVGRSSQAGLVLAVLAILPPGVVMLLAQRQIAKGLSMTQSSGLD